MIISEGTFNCFLSTLSGVAKTPSEDCQLSQIYSSDGRHHCHCWDGKVFNPSKYPYRHLHIQRITSWPDWCWGPPGLSVAARSVPACCVLSELTCCCSDGTHLASSGRPSCGHQSTWSAASWPPQPPAASPGNLVTTRHLLLPLLVSLSLGLVSVYRGSVVTTAGGWLCLGPGVSGVSAAVSPAQLTTPRRPAGAQHSGQKLAPPPPPAFCCCHTLRRDKKVHP